MAYTPNGKGRRIRLVENSVERVARMLSQQHGIKVVWSPGTAKTDGKTIYLPTLPDDAPDELLEAVQGYLDHETAHIIFTDFNAAKQLRPQQTAEQFACSNVVEDLRIEEALGKLFPGSPYNLRKAHDWLYTQIGDNWKKLNQFQKASSAYFHYKKYGETEFWDGLDPKTKELVKQCDKAVGSVDALSSTHDSLNAGMRMFKVLEQYAEEEQKAREKREEEKKKPGNQQSGQVGQQQLGQAPPGQGTQPKAYDRYGNPVVPKGPSNKDPVTSMGDMAKALAEAGDKMVEVSNGRQATTQLPGGIDYTHDLPHDSTYIPYSTQYDTVQSMPDGNLTNNGKRLSHLRDEARELTAVIRTKLVNSLRAMAKRRWVGGKEEGKIDSRRLHRAMLGLGVDVFKQKTDKMHLDTVVGLAIDHSGSMMGRKLELAGEAAIVIGDALNTLKIPFMVYGYSTDAAREQPKDTSLYARWSHLWIRYYRDFNESWEKGAIRLAGSSHNCKENTLDAESVKHGIRRLLTRTEKRKILFVFNDGMPYPGYGNLGRCQQHLRDVIASASTAGVEVVAFGIEDPDVKYYYPNNVVIQNLTDLVKEPLQKIDSMLRAGIKLQ